MQIERVIIKNYKCIESVDIQLNKELNIIVGNNEAGKSSLLEAINLALSNQLNGRPFYAELSPNIFNQASVSKYLADLKASTSAVLPVISIELYFTDVGELAKFKGTHNSRRDPTPGISLAVDFNEELSHEYQEFIEKGGEILTLPIEYYSIRWQSFAGNAVTSHTLPIRATLIDTSMMRSGMSAYSYVLKIVENVLDPKQRIDMSLAYRRLKEAFANDEGIAQINNYFATLRGEITDKNLTIGLDTSARASWESGLTPHLDNVPFNFVGKGEQSSVKMKLALEASAQSALVLIEEPENHLSYINMSKLVSAIRAKSQGRQLIITTHSSFVLNKLGIDSVILFRRNAALRISGLDPSTRDYFMKMPGHDTLRLILADRTILVEGPSDELLVQKAFSERFGCMPIDKGIDVISVRSLSFDRWLQIAVKLGLKVDVVTDNDGSVAAIKKKYKAFEGLPNIQLHYDLDENLNTLEPQLLHCNGRDHLNAILSKSYATDSELIHYMSKNKAEWALKVFESTLTVELPKYIKDAIS